MGQTPDVVANSFLFG